MSISDSDRSSLIRLASALPKGDELRRAILSALKTSEYSTLTYLRPQDLSKMSEEDIAGELAWLKKERRRLAGVLNRMDDGNTQGRTVSNQLDALEARITEILMFTKAPFKG